MDFQDVRDSEGGRARTAGGWKPAPRSVTRALLAATLAAAAVVVLPGSALAQTTTNQFFRVVSAGPPGAARTVVGHGVITGVGTEVITSNPPGVATVTWTFPEGTLDVRLAYTFENVFDPRTCLRRLTLTGTWEITGGTGSYSGATGSGTFSGTNRILLNRTADGCAPPPIVLVQVFTMTGNVSLAANAAA